MEMTTIVAIYFSGALLSLPCIMIDVVWHECNTHLKGYHYAMMFLSWLIVFLFVGGTLVIWFNKGVEISMKWLHEKIH